MSTSARSIPLSLPDALRSSYLDILVQLDLMAASVSVVKRKRASANVHTRKPFDRLLGAARAIPRAANPHWCNPLIFHYGPRALWGPPRRAVGDEAGAVDGGIRASDRAEYEACFKIFLYTCKDLEGVLKHIQGRAALRSAQGLGMGGDQRSCALPSLTHSSPPLMFSYVILSWLDVNFFV
ncbi:hypothetical protein C8F01DRAFT_1260799 [Mycena amicta]|nr:hypothetical protein C8F01DRAFT_1260799 [Mycena amicta]